MASSAWSLCLTPRGLLNSPLWLLFLALRGHGPSWSLQWPFVVTSMALRGHLHGPSWSVQWPFVVTFWPFVVTLWPFVVIYAVLQLVPCCLLLRPFVVVKDRIFSIFK